MHWFDHRGIWPVPGCFHFALAGGTSLRWVQKCFAGSHHFVGIEIKIDLEPGCGPKTTTHPKVRIRFRHADQGRGHLVMRLVPAMGYGDER
jgi:hypothetical protein